MSVNYMECNGKKILRDHPDTACYSSIFSCGVKEGATEVILYESHFTISLKVIPEWVKALNLCGFPCKYLGKGYEKYKIDDQYHVFRIDLSKYKYKNYLCSTLTLLRYMFEDEYYNCIEAFFKIKESVKEISNFNALLMSFLYIHGNNHTCHHQEFKRKFVTKKRIFDNFALGPGIYTNRHSNIFSCWEIGKLINVNRVNDYNKIYNFMRNKGKSGVYVVGGNNEYANWLTEHKVVDKMEDASLVLFTGGEDVSPLLYGEPVGEFTSSNLYRDNIEKKEYEKAKKLSLKCLGICRGSQFLCVMNGGKLVQHQKNPQEVHEIDTVYGRMNITSTHHQAAYPYNLRSWDYTILGWTNGISDIHLDGMGKELNPRKECEIVHYSKGIQRGDDLGIQGHPEFGYYQRDPNNKKSIEILNKIVDNFLQDKM